MKHFVVWNFLKKTLAAPTKLQKAFLTNFEDKHDEVDLEQRLLPLFGIFRHSVTHCNTFCCVYCKFRIRDNVVWKRKRLQRSIWYEDLRCFTYCHMISLKPLWFHGLYFLWLCRDKTSNLFLLLADISRVLCNSDNSLR